MKKLDTVTAFIVLYVATLILGTYYTGSRLAPTPAAEAVLSIPIPLGANIYEIIYHKDKASYVYYKTLDGKCHEWSKNSMRNTIKLTNCPTPPTLGD